MRANPLISVVLPTYNGAEYLRDSIESVINQTFENWELIIVDDNSSDETPKIIDEYIQKDSRIKTVHNSENLKLPKSLNEGFKSANGKYFTWTSDDNMYLAEAFDTMYAYMENHPLCPMVVCDTQMYDVITCKKSLISYNPKRMLIENSVGACFLYRREVYDKIGGYDTDLFGVEDYEYWLRVLKNCGDIDRINKILYYYRSHPNSLTQKKRDFILKQKRILFAKYDKWIIDHLDSDYDSLLHIYNELMMNEEYSLERLRSLFVDIIPCLSGDKEIPADSKIILMGAGAFGKTAFKILSDQVVYFADHSLDKIGSMIEGKKIISYEKMIDLIKNDIEYHVVISVSSDKQFQIIKELYESDIYSYSVMARCFRKR